MKKAIAMIVLLAAVLFSTVASSDEILFSDSFEAYPAGAPLTGNYGGWVAWYNSVNDPYNNIFTNQYSSDGSMSLQQYGSHSGCWASAVSRQVVLPTEFIFEVDVMASGEVDNSYLNVCGDDRQDLVVALYSDFNPWGHGAWLAAFPPGRILWTPGMQIDNNVEYMRWYNLRMKIDRIAGNVDYWLDGVHMGQQFNPAYLTWGPTLQHLTFGSGCGKGWIDKVRVYTDNTTPVTTLSLAGTPGENDTYWSDVSVTLAADDGPVGSGVAYTEYSLDAGATWTRYAGPFTLAAEGSTVVDYRSADKVGQVEPYLWEEVKIDRTAPVVSGTDPANGAMSVPVSQAIAVTFSEPVQAGANIANVKLYKARIAPDKVVAVTTTIAGNVLSIVPTQNLNAGTLYRVVIPQGAVKDLSGHPLAADFPPFSFTTSP